MQVKVYAKLNLSLNVYHASGKFHDIDSVVTSVDICDTVTVTPRADKRVTVSGCSGVPVRQNSAYKAAKLFVNAFGSCGVDISICKGIPLSAGLGGSSADAAAVIYCMCALYGADTNDNSVRSVCAQVGSDVNFMLRGGLARMRGKGDDVQFLPYCPLSCAVVLFDRGVSSAVAYSAWDDLPAQQRVYADNDALVRLLHSGDVKGVSRLCCNGLQPAVERIDGYARAFTKFARGAEIRVAMTGSGSAYFALLSSLRQAQTAAEILRGGGYNARVCCGVPCGIVQL